MLSGDFTLVAVLCLLVPPLVFASLDDGIALIAMSEALNLDAPTWTNGTDPCQLPKWDYVFCNIDHVNTLNLSGLGLEGPIPVQVGDLSELQVLDLQDNKLNGSIPVTIANLRQSLQYLNLSSNNFTGPFPKAILQLTKLVDLRIDNNFLAGPLPADIKNLTELTILLLGGNQFIGPIPSQSLGSLVHLITLEIWGNPFNDTLPVELGLLPRITKLIMHRNGLSGQLPSLWSSNSFLEVLEMQWNNIDGLVPESWMRLRSVGSLKILKLDHNRLEGYFPLWTSAIRDSVDLSCNFFTGKFPAGYSPTSWKGNCFSDIASEYHSDAACADGTLSDSCHSFTGELPLDPPQLYFPPKNAESDSSRSGAAPGAMIGAVIAVVSAVIVAGLVCLWRCKARRKQAQKLAVDDPYSLRETDLVTRKDHLTVSLHLRRFSIKELRAVTGGFSKEHEIGEGGFGKVYYAKLKTGEEVAVKKANTGRVHGAAEFQNEMILLSQISHPNLLGITGFCDEAGEQILVYEFMKNGNLLDCLTTHLGATLDWHKRLEIASQIAGALHYLHYECKPRIIHRDIKPSNILLDGNMVAKLSDFGISKMSSQDTHVSTRPAGTNGYLDPDYFLRFQLTTASDVYSFGIVLLELITGQKAIDKTRGSEEPNLAMWVYSRLNAGGINAIIDPLLKVQDYPEAAYQRLAWLALDCSAPEKDNRPSITVVLRTLEETIANVRKPPSQMTGVEPGRVFYGPWKQYFSDSSDTATTSTAERAAAASMHVMPR